MNTIIETFITNKETRTLKELLPLLLKRRLFTKISTCLQSYIIYKYIIFLFTSFSLNISFFSLIYLGVKRN